jgi:hypothetical protein
MRLRMCVGQADDTRRLADEYRMVPPLGLVGQDAHASPPEPAFVDISPRLFGDRKMRAAGDLAIWRCKPGGRCHDALDRDAPAIGC